jgi:hypothetical protein
MIQKQRNIIFTLISYKKFKHVILVLWIICIILLLNGNEKVLANNCIYKNFQSDFKAKKNYEKSPLSINYFPFTTQHTILTISHSLLSINQSKLSTYNLPLSTHQDTCPTGHETDIWYVDSDKVLNFNSGTPVIDTGYVASFGEACTAICDYTGKFLFYTDNRKLYNRNHKPMKGNLPSFTYISSTMSLILPRPNSDSIYYWFTPDSQFGLQIQKLYYHQVNMNRNGGNGEIVQAEQVLMDTSSERVTAVRHCNGRDWWIVGQHGYDERLFVWLMDTSGIHKQVHQIYDPQFQRIKDNHLIAGYMKFSPDGNVLAEHNHSFDGKNISFFIGLHKFDPSTGYFYNSLNIEYKDYHIAYDYGLEFSPSGRYLYLTESFIRQFDLKHWNADSIANSRVNIARISLVCPSLCNDGKIYLTNPNKTFVSTINNPEQKGLKANFEYKAIDLGPNQVAQGAPSPARGLMWPYRTFIKGEYEVCKQSRHKYFISDPCPHEPVQWTMVDSAQLRTVQGLDTVDVYFPRPGKYRIAAAYPVRCGFKSDTITVDVYDCSCKTLWKSTMKDTQVCYLANITIPYQTNAQYVKINQNYFYPDDSIVIKQIKADTCLDITLSNFFGCDTTFRYCIDVYDRVRSTMDTVRLCYGDSIFIKDRYYSFTDQVVTLYDNMNGCDSMHTTHLRYYSPARSIAQTYTLCNGDSIFINGIWHSKSSDFSYSAKSIYGCDSLIYDVQIKLQSATTPTMREHYICNGDSIFINNQWIKSAQRIETKLKSFTGCDSIIMHEIKLHSDITPTMREHYICNGDSIFINNQWIKSAQRIETKLKSFTGCDSLIMHEIKLYPAIAPTMYEHYICNGDSILINNQWIKSAQSIETKLKSFTGCDSILQDNIIIKPLFTRKIQFYICYGDSVQVLGAWYDEEIQFDRRISSSNPALCDSLIEYQIIQYEDIYVDLPQSIEIEEGAPLTLTSSYSPNAKTFRWSPSQDLSCIDCPNPICISSIDRIYYLEVSDEFGCISSDSILVFVKKKSGEFFFPNAFSPNTDGLNDLWIPVASSTQLTHIAA